MMATALKVVDRGRDKVVVECPRCLGLFEITERYTVGEYNSQITLFTSGVIWPSRIVCPNLKCDFSDDCHLIQEKK